MTFPSRFPDLQNPENELAETLYELDGGGQTVDDPSPEEISMQQEVETEVMERAEALTKAIQEYIEAKFQQLSDGVF
jgi:hypothetical protein